MKRILLAVFIFISLGCSSQQWIRTYETNYGANWVIEDYDKGYLILGTNEITYRYGLIIKTDINGNVLWKKHLGNGGYLFAAMNVELTSDQGLVIGGTMSKYDNQQDAFILKLNACGDLDWCTDVYTPTIPDDLGWKVKPTPDKGYVLLGEFNDPNQNLRTNLFKFDSSGNLIWHQAYLPDSLAFEDDGQDLLVDSTGYLITAVVYYPDPGQGGGYERFYFIKTDASGNKLWSCIYGKNSYYHGVPWTTLYRNTGYYSFGFHDVNGSSSFYPSIVKITPNGLDSYNKDIIPHAGAIGTANWLNDTILILGGGGGDGNTTLNVMYKIDTLGTLLDSAHLLVINNANAMACTAKTFDNKFISVATDCPSNCHIIAFKVNANLQWDSIYTHQYTYDSLCPNPIVSDTIDPNCQLVVNVEEPLTNPGTCQIKVFPNPADERLTIVFPKYLQVMDNSPPVKSTTIYHQWNQSTLEVYFLNGEKIFQKDIPKDQTQLEVDVSTWKRGLYFFRLLYNKQTVAGEKVILK